MPPHADADTRVRKIHSGQDQGMAAHRPSRESRQLNRCEPNKPNQRATRRVTPHQKKKEKKNSQSDSGAWMGNLRRSGGRSVESVAHHVSHSETLASQVGGDDGKTGFDNTLPRGEKLPPVNT